jgi:hypothetical protein
MFTSLSDIKINTISYIEQYKKKLIVWLIKKIKIEDVKLIK